MYIARFEIAGWMNPEQHEIEGESAEDLFEQLQEIQDLEYLVQSGRLEGNTEDAEELDKIEALLDKYNDGELELEDIEDFEIDLTGGCLRCVSLEEE